MKTGTAEIAWFDSRLRADGASACLAEADVRSTVPAEAGLTMSARPEPFDSPLILSLSKDEPLAQDRLVEGRVLRG
jgi:hypothetical protein